MPFGADEVLIGLACGPDPRTGRWRGFYAVRVDAGALRRLGLHPDQPTSKVAGPAPPEWWHAEAERTAGW
ncbi:hypothetical protein [Dactylosporangium sp. CA-233914]|uniref:hypothetical protein n=1 Tax=Dactylosporangium sp. CA-233914 TaxID=3239934 RepID=UPI003D8CF611